MKVERFSITKKGEFIDNAQSMHDCSFIASYENNILTLSFDHLDQHTIPPSDTPCYETFKKLTIKYHGVNYLYLDLKFKKKELDYYDTVSPLDGKELIMYKYALDSMDAIQLHFRIMLRKKLWGGRIEISPTDIEYIWE